MINLPRFELEIEPITWHAWCVLPDGSIKDWNSGQPSDLTVCIHDCCAKSKLRFPYEPVYEEIDDPDVIANLEAKQQAVVRQWVRFSTKTWPELSFLDTWEDSKDMCLLSSWIYAKRFGGRIAFGRFGWRRCDGSIYLEYDGLSKG